LLKAAREPYSTLVMWELPLPPLGNRYGIAQRRLASVSGVHLIPKRELIAALACAGGTVDGVHLSDTGQRRLADALHPAIGGGVRSLLPGEYGRYEPPGTNPTPIQPP